MPVTGATAVTPSAARLTESLRDIGYDFPAAVADIVDNSIMAGASQCHGDKAVCVRLRQPEFGYDA